MRKTISNLSVPLSKVKITKEIEDRVLEVLRSGRYVQGEEVKKFEEEFAMFCGVKYAAAVGSGTAALHLSLMACGIAKGDEVVTSPFTFIAPFEAIMSAGARPTFVDIETDAYNLDPKALKSAITGKTKAILPIHLFGHTANMGPIVEEAEKRGIHIIEDACQAHGSLYNGKKAGSIGTVGCFSFYPTKVITVCGEGGMLVTNDEEVYNRVVMLRNHGRVGQETHMVPGYNFRMTEISAAIGRVQLKHVKDWISRRRSLASNYTERIGRIEGVTPPIEKEWAYHTYTYYVIRVKKRDELMQWLRSRGIETRIYYKDPIHKQPAYTNSLPPPRQSLQVSEDSAKSVLALPIYPSMKTEDLDRVAESLDLFFASRKLPN